MHHPGDDSGDNDAEPGIAGDRVHENAHAGRIFSRRQRIEQDMQRQQHQAETDRDPTDVLDARARAAAEGDQAENGENGSGGGNVERQDLNNQRGPNIRTEHDCKRRHQTDQTFGSERARDQGGRGAALQQGCQADARCKGGEAVLQGFRQKQTEIGAESAQNSAVNHVQAPQQQRDAAQQVEKNQASHDHPLPDRVERSGYRQTTGDQSFYSRGARKRGLNSNVHREWFTRKAAPTAYAAWKAAKPLSRSAVRSSAFSSPM